jgi:hypothetical protein
MTTTRRAILMAGGGAVAIVGAGAAGFALTRVPKRALLPWSAAGTPFGDPRLDALAFAILAPNPHNMQPWRIRLEGENAFLLHADLSRMLPETDPPNRQITIGFGAFLELFRQAAAQQGARAEIDPFPEGEPLLVLDERPVARVRLVEDPATPKDPLFAEVLRRRTNRSLFAARALAAADLERVKAASVGGVYAEATLDPERIAALKALARAAWRVEWTTPAKRRESIEVTRIGRAEIEAAPFGLALSGAGLEAAAALGLLSREKMDAAGEVAYEQGLANYAAAIDTAAGFLWTTTATNTRRDQLEAGRAWVRMQLAATAAGLAFHPLSQALQEFPEMAEHYRQAHALLASGGGVVQMLARLGYAQAPPPAPREALAAKLIPA